MKTSTAMSGLCLLLLFGLVSQTLACRRQCKGGRRKRSEDESASPSVKDILHNLLEGKKLAATQEESEALKSRKMHSWPEVFSEWRRTVSDWYMKMAASKENTPKSEEKVSTDMTKFRQNGSSSADDTTKSETNASSSVGDMTKSEKNVFSSIHDMTKSEEDVSLSSSGEMMAQYYRQMSDTGENTFDAREEMSGENKLSESEEDDARIQ